MFYRGFLDLTSARQLGHGGLGPISLLQMMEYCFLMEMGDEQRDDFCWIVARLDEKYLTWAGKKQKAGK